MSMHTPATDADDLRALREQAMRSAAAGDYADAIGLGARYLRQVADADLEQLSLEWRRKGFISAPPPIARQDWPPAYPDPFPDCKGLPEIARADLTIEVMAGAILHHGSLLVRGMVGQETVDTCVAAIEQAVTDWARHGADYDELLATPRYRRLPSPEYELGRSWVERDGAAIYLADSPRTAAEFIALLHSLGLPALVESYLGEMPALSAGKTALRRVPPTMATTSWHQDGSFLGTDIRSLNLWLCLSDAGVDASGLDLVPRRLDRLMERGTGGAYFDWDVGDEVARAAAGPDGIASPVFRPGDAMLFDHMMLHRTSLPPGMTRTRYAVEAWMFAPSHYPREHIALML